MPEDHCPRLRFRDDGDGQHQCCAERGKRCSAANRVVRFCTMQPPVAEIRARNVGHTVARHHETTGKWRKSEHLDVDKSARQQEAKQHAVRRYQHRGPSAKSWALEHNVCGIRRDQSRVGDWLARIDTNRIRSRFIAIKPHPNTGYRCKIPCRDKRRVSRKIRDHRWPINCNTRATRPSPVNPR